jgi:glycosyltransferase involved in cell wall biosynthesis
MHPLISVIIPARNEEKFLPRCLEALERATEKIGTSLVEVVVVLNRCTDRTEEIAVAAGCRTVSCEEKNLSVIRNLGVRASTGDIIVTIDADSFMSENFLATVVTTLKSGDSIGGGCLILPERWSLGILCTGIVVGLLFVWHRISVGAFFCFRDDFEAIGGFDESLVSVEDIDFAQRLRRYGRSRNLRYNHLMRASITTSCRKFDVFGDWYFLCHPREVFALLKGRQQELANKVWYDFPRQ